MNAGESARQEARRARERAERLSRRADMFEKGAAGESRTASDLAALGPEWVMLHDHRWPGRRFANIDHVVVGPGGIFVIDSKNWSGELRVDGHVLRQNGRSREKAVASAADAALAVAELAGPHSGAVRPVICFVRDDEVCGWARDVMICSSTNIVQMLQTRPRVLDAAQASAAATRLDASLRDAAMITTDTLSGPGRSPSRTRPLQAGAGRGTSRGRKRGTTSPGRLFVALVGAFILLASLPTLLPAVSSAISDAFVEHLVLGKEEECAVIEIGAPRDEDQRRRIEKLPPECR